MAEAHAHHGHQHHHGHDHGHEHAHAHPNYVKIWAILLGLLVVSVVGPFVGIKAVTLITAFGIAVVKAYLVVTNFMHINVEKRYIVYMMASCLIFMLLFFAGAAPDVMKDHGAMIAVGGEPKPQWEKPRQGFHPEIPVHVEGGEAHGEAGHAEH